MKKTKLADKLLLWIVSFQTILMGIFFIVQILRIYYGNDKTFTMDICGKYIVEILPVIIIWVLLIIGSYIYFYVNKYNDKNISKISNISKLNNLERLYDVTSAELVKEKKNRKVFSIINIVIIVVCSLFGLLYLVNVKNFDSQGDLSKQAIEMTVHLLPWAIISFSSFIAFCIYEEYSARKSINIIKELIKNSSKKQCVYTENKNKKLAINIARAVIIVVSICLIVIGIFDGSVSDVLQKAINICTECIGLG